MSAARGGQHLCKGAVEQRDEDGQSRAADGIHDFGRVSDLNRDQVGVVRARRSKGVDKGLLSTAPQCPHFEAVPLGMVSSAPSPQSAIGSAIGPAMANGLIGFLVTGFRSRTGTA